MSYCLIYADNGGGRPAATPLDPVPGTAVAHRQVTVTSYDIGYGAIAAGYDATFAPVHLDAGTTYWLTIAARDSYTWDEGDGTGYGWLWWGRSGTGNALQGGTEFLNPAIGSDGWYQQGRQQEFILTVVAVPEPGTITLLVIGAMGLLGAAHRKRRS